ncbi:MAG: DUF1805 domain-containing protein [Endomicrobium sp.]|jgi:uncharacterized protein YunC (DUF1805 family)|nr:DUF1805 domain-containing protein [Endomicrobium sp.]
MQIKEIMFNGKTFKTFEGEIAPGSFLVFITGKKGFIMCGYLNLETAEKLQNIAAIATGIKCVEDMLNALIVKATSYAQSAGITVGMPVIKALEKIS